MQVGEDDFSADVYCAFFDYYNENLSFDDIRCRVEEEFREEKDSLEDGHLFWLALAKAQWQAGRLDEDVLKKVQHIIESGLDRRAWKELGAMEEDLVFRGKELESFYQQIKTKNPKPKKRKRKVLRDSIFETGDCLVFRMSNGNYGAAVVLASERQTELGLNIIAATRINQEDKPSLDEIKSAELLIKSFGSWGGKEEVAGYFAQDYARDKDEFERIGKIDLPSLHGGGIYEFKDMEGSPPSYVGAWRTIIDMTERQLDHETKNPRPKEKAKVERYFKKKKISFWVILLVWVAIWAIVKIVIRLVTQA